MGFQMTYMCEAVIGQDAEKIELGWNVKGFVCKKRCVIRRMNWTNVVSRPKTLWIMAMKWESLETTHEAT